MPKPDLSQQAQPFWQTIDETQIWEAFRQGQPQAFQAMVKHFYRPLHFYGGRFTRDADLLNDCLQDLFLDLWTYRHKIIQTTYIRPYLYKALRGKIYRQLTGHRERVGDETMPFDELSSGDITAEQAIIHTELAEYQTNKLNALLGQLSDRQREAIHLKFYADLTNDEIATILDVNKQSVANLLHRGLSRLRASWSSLLSLAICWLWVSY